MITKKTKQASPLHFRRIELKYLVPDRLIPVFIDHLAPYVQPDSYLLEEGMGRTSYPVTSLYFDSIDLNSLQEKEAGLLSRRKLRLRTYGEYFTERSPAFLEIKRRHDFVVSKDRLSLSVGHLKEGLPMSALIDHVLGRVEASEEVYTEANLLRRWYNLVPTALVNYQRIPFVGMQDRRFRITIDHHLKGAWKIPSLLGPQFIRSVHEGISVLELKCNHAIPAWFHDCVKDLQMDRVAHSKYAMVVEGLRPAVAVEY
ncbi:polyphosphate polymerase domain-containing protein [Patescibacteria group bacterium]|nr:polyphosphate polymerase domain-containing protein [Patescibacteria group bacterium]MBU1123330.1 polyphosphate polymerase domain-containing protein [Patescibacteria group bacterium]MBU1911399.1 polyphosphate polymerase domain-containing protein [Patescibacteria group bacterium]